MSKPEKQNEKEVRSFRSLGNVEVRASDDGATVKVEGYAAVYNEVAKILDWYEVILPGAFDECLRRGDDAQFLIDHWDLPLARVSSGTLKLSTDSYGLKVSTELDITDPDVMRVVPKMKRGDMSKMSFGFRMYPDGLPAGEQRWITREDGTELREIIRVGSLADVSIVPEPAYQGTEIALRSRDAARGVAGDQNEFENSRAKRKMALALRSRGGWPKPAA